MGKKGLNFSLPIKYIKGHKYYRYVTSANGFFKLLYDILLGRGIRLSECWQFTDC